MEEMVGRGLPRIVMNDVFLEPVHVNAGGNVYTTTLDTLTKYTDSKLAKLFDGRLPITIDRLTRHYFLDINGTVFAYVLDFLRHGELLLPQDFTQIPLLIKLAEFLEIQEMLEALNVHENEKFEEQNESDDDNSNLFKGNRMNKRTKNKCVEKDFERNYQKERMNSEGSVASKNIGSNKNLDSIQFDDNKMQNVEKRANEDKSVTVKSLDIEGLKSKTTEMFKVEVNNVQITSVEADVLNTEKMEVKSLKSVKTEMPSIEAVNVEMKIVEAGTVMTTCLEVGSLMAETLEVGTLRARNLETDDMTTGPVKVAMVRYDEYYKIIDVYSTDELTLVDPMYPHRPIKSGYVGNCNRLFYKFETLDCTNPQTTYKFGVPYLLHFFKQLLGKGYRFTSVISATELNYTRDYVLIRLPTRTPSRP